MRVRLPTFAWPTFRWEGTTWWAGMGGAALSGIAIVLPVVASDPVTVRVAKMIAAAILFPLIFLLTSFVIRASVVLIRRTLHFSALASDLERAEQELGDTKSMLLSALQESGKRLALEIHRVQRYGVTIYVLIRESPIPLSKGDRLAVIDTTDNVILGEFAVVERRTDGYRAKNVRLLDPVWAGQLQNVNAIDTYPPPNSIAVLISGEPNDGS